MRKFLIKFTLFFVCTFLLFIAIDYLFYLRYFTKISKEPDQKHSIYPEVKNAGPETIKRIGWIKTDRKSFFTNFKDIKEAGTIRIGCFGASFTYGTGVEDGYDYPLLLQKKFREKGFKNVEVINYGVTSYGFHQAFILWKEAGRNMDLDFALFDPFSVDGSNADSTFEEKQFFPDNSYKHLYLFHSRFILEGQDLRLVDIFQENPVQTFNHYHSFIPSISVLLYDKHSPAFIRCLLPRGQELFNPFYYMNGNPTEIYETYRRLFSKMLASSMQFVVASLAKNTFDPIKAVEGKNLLRISLPPFNEYPYRLPDEHYNALGNELLATLFFCILTKETKCKVPILEFSNLIEQRTSKNVAYKFDSFSETKILFGNNPMGHLINKGVQKDLGDRAIRALLLLKGKTDNPMDATFLPLDFDLEKGTPVILRLKGAGSQQEFEIGKVDFLQGNAKIATFEAANSDFPLEVQYQSRVFFNIKNAENKMISGSNIETFVLLKDRPILQGKVDFESKRIILEPIDPQQVFLWMSFDKGKNFDFSRLPKIGDIFLATTNETKGPKIHFARWRLGKHIVALDGAASIYKYVTKEKGMGVVKATQEPSIGTDK